MDGPARGFHARRFHLLHQEVAGMSRLRHVFWTRMWMIRLGLMVAALAWLAPLSAQVNPDQAADMLLNSARKAYNEKNYPFARDRFKEFIAKFAGNKNAP